MISVEFDAFGDGYGNWSWVATIPDGLPVPVAEDVVATTLEGCGCEDEHLFVVEKREYQIDGDGNVSGIALLLKPAPADLEGASWRDDAHNTKRREEQERFRAYEAEARLGLAAIGA